MAATVLAGGCHCGAVRFEAAIDLAAGTVKCNCSICLKARMWSARVAQGDFRVTAGEAELVDYRGRNPVAHHFFCRRCGVHPFARVDMPNMSGAPYVNVSVVCLDDLEVAALVAAPVTYCDGANDDWGHAPAEVRHL
jgi:hypothetical protein